jgi:exopolysaccharide production protein ExoZ
MAHTTSSSPFGSDLPSYAPSGPQPSLLPKTGTGLDSAFDHDESASGIVSHGTTARIALTRFLAGIYELSNEDSRFPAMEGIRGLAILLVFFVHYHTLFSPYVRTGSLTFRISNFSWGMGQSGVDLFFVLSGYLIYGAVIRKPVNYFRFMKRRVVRIYPTFACVFVLYLGLSLIFPAISKLPSGWWGATKYILMNLALLPGIFSITPLITVAWSLSYEFFFYISIPLLVMLTSMRNWRRWHRALFFAALAILRFGVLTVLPLRMVMFIGGILVYEGLHSDWLRARLSRTGEALSALVFFGSFVPIALLEVQQESASTLGPLTIRWGPNRIFLMCMSFSLFAIYCLGRNGFLSRVFSWTPLRWMGNMSYSYYLIHGVTLQGLRFVCQRLWPAEGTSFVFFWSLLPIAILSTLATSTVLFCLVEKPFSLQKKPNTVANNA